MKGKGKLVYDAYGKYKAPDPQPRKKYVFQFDGMKIAIIALAIILIGVIFKQRVFELEVKAIVYLRENYYNDNLELLWKLLIIPTELRVIQILLVVIYCYSDPLLAYKWTFVTIIQIFFVSVLKLFSGIPRPYWLNHKMEPTECFLDYSGPSDHIWIGAMFYTYIILIFYYKYVEKINKYVGK